MSEEEYIPERDNDLESEEEESNNDLLKIQDKALKDIIKEGGLRVENIIEIQWMMELIKYVPENYKDKQDNIAKCLELIINLANQYLVIYSKQNEK